AKTTAPNTIAHVFLGIGSLLSAFVETPRPTSAGPVKQPGSIPPPPRLCQPPLQTPPRAIRPNG
ncbi:MAG: hypothetical protein JSU86_09430, partial [Phycisphaerales bacterium]